MAIETMTKDERMWAALRYEDKPDRVPVAMPMGNGYAAKSLGYTQADVTMDGFKGVDAHVKAYDDFGGCDAIMVIGETLEADVLIAQLPLRFKLPGKELPDDYQRQAHEAEILKPEDYDRIIEQGWTDFYYNDYIYRISDWAPEEIDDRIQYAVDVYDYASKKYGERDMQDLFCSGDGSPFYQLSLTRSLIPFSEDLFFSSDKLAKVMDVMLEDSIKRVISDCKDVKKPIIMYGEERASGSYYPLDIFEKFWMPYATKFVDAMISEGIFIAFHLDNNFIKNLEYFKQFPKNSFCLQLDSTTDIFAAKEILKGHCSLMGDVPPSLLSLGSKEEVEAYCKKLIDEVGYDGGFILSPGCEVPANCKPENLKAMVDFTKTYEFSK